jgi:CDP-paratose 2-epimerase
MKILITGGAGFIGVNCAAAFAEKGHAVVIFDNLSRRGSEHNLSWVRNRGHVEFVRGDIRDFGTVADMVQGKGPFHLVLHLAAQVAVTSSVVDPRTDFEVNALGTLNLLEAVRLHDPGAAVIYASTNKVYGEMTNLAVSMSNGRYTYTDRPAGITEKQCLDFHSPYGCSKGSADQYCRDYARMYGLKTVVMRQSCIYGYHQFGIEDQGWVAWFCIATALGKPVTIYGDGGQVRDVLFIDDLVQAYERAFEQMDRISGETFNIGGGPGNTLSLHELIHELETLAGRRIPLNYSDWRPGDQKIYIGDISLAREKLGWIPAVRPREGIQKLYSWVIENRAFFETF